MTSLFSARSTITADHVAVDPEQEWAVVFDTTDSLASFPLLTFRQEQPWTVVFADGTTRTVLSDGFWPNTYFNLYRSDLMGQTSIRSIRAKIAMDSSGWTESLSEAWRDKGLVSFPPLDLSGATNFDYAWYNNELSSFPAGINISNGTSFGHAWSFCNLVSFPPLDLGSGVSFNEAWSYNSLMETFGAVNVDSGVDFTKAWFNASITSFPDIAFPEGELFAQAWRGCQYLRNFPAISFPSGTDFTDAWKGTILTAQSVQNVLVALDANGGVNKTTEIGKDSAALTTQAQTAYNSLIAKGWTVTLVVTGPPLEEPPPPLIGWVVQTGTPSISGTKGGSRSIAITEDGSMLAYAKQETTAIYVYNTTDWSLITTLTPAADTYSEPSICFSPDGSMLAYAGDRSIDSVGVRVYNTTTWQLVTPAMALAANMYSITFSPDGSMMATSAATTGGFRVFNTTDWTDIAIANKPPATRLIAFSPDSTKMVCASVSSSALYLYTSLGVSYTSKSLTQTPLDIAFNADGSRLYVILNNSTNRLAVYDSSNFPTLTLVAGTPVIAGSVTCCAYVHSDNSLMMGGTSTPYLRILDCATNTLREITTPVNAVSCCAAAKDSVIAATNAGVSKLTVYR